MSKFYSQFNRGNGSQRREFNIQQTKEMLKKGIPQREIELQLSMLFKQSTVAEYLQIANQILNLEKKGNATVFEQTYEQYVLECAEKGIKKLGYDQWLKNKNDEDEKE